jgi:hypothetical protein
MPISVRATQALSKALTNAVLDTCFPNPDTSEIKLVYEKRLTENVHPVLSLEGDGVTGAAAL